MPPCLILQTDTQRHTRGCSHLWNRDLPDELTGVWVRQVGVTAMLVASKYEEIWAPEVKDFVFISDEAYTREQILEMEKIMLNTLRFNLTVPTAFAFLHRYLKAGVVPRHPQVRRPAHTRCCHVMHAAVQSRPGGELYTTAASHWRPFRPARM